MLKKAISGAIAHVESLVVRVTMCFIATSNCDSTISRCDGERGSRHRSCTRVLGVINAAASTAAGGSGCKSFQRLAQACSGIAGSQTCRQSSRKAFSCRRQSVFCQFVIKSRKRPMPDSVHPFRPGWPANDERQSDSGKNDIVRGAMKCLSA
jgi:hypothetical protein